MKKKAPKQDLELDKNSIEGRLSQIELPRNFWERPKNNLTGDSISDSLYAAVGKALSCWETVEIAMTSLFTVIVQSKSDVASRAALRIYGGISSTNAKIDALRNGGEVFFNQPGIPKALHSSFRKLMNNYSSASTLRNEIAHGLVCRHNQDKHEVEGYFLIPNIFNTRRVNIDLNYYPLDDPSISKDTLDTVIQKSAASYFKNAQYRYTSSQIDEISKRFQRLTMLPFLFLILIPSEFRIHHQIYNPKIQKLKAKRVNLI